MAEMLSPGVFVSEVNASTIAPTVSTSVGVFCGDFQRGPVDSHLLITSVSELQNFYGTPSLTNYNDFFQAYNFLQYGNKLLLSRASNVNGTITPITTAGGASVTASVGALNALTVTVSVGGGAAIVPGSIVSFDAGVTKYAAVSILGDVITLDRPLSTAIVVGTPVNTIVGSMNAVYETGSGVNVTNPQATFFGANIPVKNDNEFATLYPIIAFSATTTQYKFIARNPGSWGNSIEIAIAFNDQFGSLTPAMAFTGLPLDPLFEYTPQAANNEFGIIIRENGVIVETWTVSSNVNAKDVNNKSLYVEDVINTLSQYVYVKDNVVNTNSNGATLGGPTPITSYLASSGTATTTAVPFLMVTGTDAAPGLDDLALSYDLFNNKEAIDIDIVIANESDGGLSAKNLVITRADCMGFMGAVSADCVGQKSAIAVSNLVNWRKNIINYDSDFMVACGNYKYQYDRYNDKYRWVNIAGDIAGLRAQTNTSRASWWASAGLERGQIKTVTKLAFNPTQGQRDLLYKNGINPIVTFPGQGTVMWGQKTLLSRPSAFDRVNVRGLFNTLERSLSKMAKYQVMEFNDTFTRNRIVSMIKPYLSSVQSGRGIQDYLVICDESNNTLDVISRNQLIVDVYIKPTYVAEFIQLRFTNAGTRAFSTIIGA